MQMGAEDLDPNSVSIRSLVTGLIGNDRLSDIYAITPTGCSWVVNRLIEYAS
jgi:hypothetical protein